MNNIIQKINKAFDETKGFLESSIVPVSFDDRLYFAFPHYKGKNRVTEFGGTSSALAAFDIVNNTKYIDKRIHESILWLGRKQKNGAWQSKGLYCSHVTAGVLCDVYGYDLGDEILQPALNYIMSCYNKEGYFLSYPSDQNEPQIYVTYICLKTLILYRNTKDIDFDKIRIWIEKSCNWDKKWGVNPCNSHSTLAHTVYALRILSMCGLTKSNLNKKYKTQIKWLKRNITILFGKYDSEEIVKQNCKDNDGITYDEVFILHSCILEVGLFCLDFVGLICSTVIAKEILLHQYNGGWGASYNRLTMWETEKSLRFLNNYKNKYLESSIGFQLMCNMIFWFSLKAILILVSVVLMSISFFWIVKSQERIDGLLISLMSSALFAIAGVFVDVGKE